MRLLREKNRIRKCIRINESNKQSGFECYGRLQRKYNVFANEWDLFEAFAGQPALMSYRENSDDDDMEIGNDDALSLSRESGFKSLVQLGSTERLVSEDDRFVDEDLLSTRLHFRRPGKTGSKTSYSTDAVEIVSPATLCYLCPVVLGTGTQFLKLWGFSPRNSFNEGERCACIVNGKQAPQDLDDLNVHNHAALKDFINPISFKWLIRFSPFHIGFSNAVFHSSSNRRTKFKTIYTGVIPKVRLVANGTLG